jgi:DNA polymerase-3 subunit delta
VAGARKTGAVVAILGEDSYLAEQALDRVLDGAIGSNRAEALEVLRGDEVTWARVTDAARTPSLFVAERAVVVRGAEGVKGSEDEILRYLEAPAEGALLVLVAGKADKRRRLWGRLDKTKAVVSAAPLKGQALRGYVAEEIRRRKLPLPGEALAELIEHLGSDLRRLVGELDKLEAFAQGRPRLTLDDVTEVLGRGLGRPVYRLGDAVMAREAALALELVQEMLDDGSDAPYLLGVLYRAVNQIRATRALKRARVHGAEIAQRLGFPPFKSDQMLAAAEAWSEDDLRSAVMALARADRGLKRGADARVTLTATLVRICRSEDPSARPRTSQGASRSPVGEASRPARGGTPTRSRAGR